MKHLLSGLVFLSVTFIVNANDNVCLTVIGAKVIAQDGNNTYLGKILDKYDSESIFDKYGNYGSKYSSPSLWDEYGDFGNKYSIYSHNNPNTPTPPMIIKNGKVIGYLSSNKTISPSISLNLLNATCNE